MSAQSRWSLRALCVLAGMLLAACGDGLAPGERIIVLEVAATRAPCYGEGIHECLQVRRSSTDPWRLLFDGIEGFTHEPGFQYRLLVAERDVPDPPADGSSRTYRLVSVLARTPVEGPGT